jgi:hypothetical protein
MSAGCANCEQVLAPTNEQHGRAVDMSDEHRTVRKGIELHSGPEVGSFEVHIVVAHLILRARSSASLARTFSLDGLTGTAVPAAGVSIVY